jgi:uncharacterized protein (TIRG00374 family)
VAIFAFLCIAKVDLVDIANTLANADGRMIAIAVLCLVLLLLLKAWRWRMLLTVQGVSYSFVKSLLIYGAGLFMGVITPARVGDFAKAFYLIDEGHSWGSSFFGVFWDRLFDLVGLLCFAGVSVLVLGYGWLYVPSAILLVIVSAAVLGYLALRRRHVANLIREWIGNLVGRLVPSSIQGGLSGNVGDFRRHCGDLSVMVLLALTAMTLAGWLIYFTMMYLLSVALGLGLSYVDTAACVSISALVALIPISIAGIGTRDATLVLLFSALGLGAGSAVAFSTMFLLIYALTSFLGLVAWTVYPIKIPVSLLGVHNGNRPSEPSTGGPGDR